MNRPRGRRVARLRIPPTPGQVGQLFAGWRGELATCRKFGPTARNYAAARLMSEVGLRINELRHLNLADIKWDLGRFGKIHVRHGKGARSSGPRERMVPLINNAGWTLRWFVEDVWGQLGDEPDRPGAPLFCSERNNVDGSAARVGSEVVRAGLAEAAAGHLPAWPDRLTPHVLCHFCASQLYLTDGFDRYSGNTGACLDSDNNELCAPHCRGRPQNPGGRRLVHRTGGATVSTTVAKPATSRAGLLEK
ncbi:MAG: site-specific integrase, partial [Pseudonocardiaceae bacterium]